jgi:hypothetical protein
MRCEFTDRMYRPHIGHLVVQNLYNEQNPTIVNYMRPLKCVALDPLYARRTSRQVLSGGLAGQLILHEKGI